MRHPIRSKFSSGHRIETFSACCFLFECMWVLTSLRHGLNPKAQPLSVDCLSGWCSTDSSDMLKQSKYLERDHGSLDFAVSLAARPVDD